MKILPNPRTAIKRRKSEKLKGPEETAVLRPKRIVTMIVKSNGKRGKSPRRTKRPKKPKNQRRPKSRRKERIPQVKLKRRTWKQNFENELCNQSKIKTKRTKAMTTANIPAID